MEYEVEDQREILLSWSRPFTWKDHPITGYLIVCWDSQLLLFHSVINDTETVNRLVVTVTVELPPDTPDCYSPQCSVLPPMIWMRAHPLQQISQFLNVSLPHSILPSYMFVSCSVA